MWALPQKKQTRAIWYWTKMHDKFLPLQTFGSLILGRCGRGWGGYEHLPPTKMEKQKQNGKLNILWIPQFLSLGGQNYYYMASSLVWGLKIEALLSFGSWWRLIGLIIWSHSKNILIVLQNPRDNNPMNPSIFRKGTSKKFCQKMDMYLLSANKVILSPFTWRHFFLLFLLGASGVGCWFTSIHSPS